MLKINGSQCTVHVYTQHNQNMLKYASFGYEKMSKKNGPNFGHLKNDQILSNFVTPKKMSKVFTGVEFGNQLLDPSRTKIKKMRSKA